MSTPTLPPREAAWNVRDDEEARRSFRWSDVMEELGGGARLNIADLAVHRHARGPSATKVALRWIGRHDETRDITYAELAATSNRFGNALRALGVQPGDVVFALCPRIPELYAAALGALSIGAVFSPLFSAFGPDPIVTRVTAAAGVVIVTTGTLYARKVAAIRDRMPTVKHVIAIEDGTPSPAGALAWRPLVEAASPELALALPRAGRPRRSNLSRISRSMSGRRRHEAQLSRCDARGAPRCTAR